MAGVLIEKGILNVGGLFQKKHYFAETGGGGSVME
jgi:hypothetical protein